MHLTEEEVMTYTHKLEGKIASFELEGSLLGDVEREQMINDFTNYLSQDVKYFVLELTKLKHINSTGLGIFITLYTKVRSRTGEMYICNPNPTITNLLSITKLNTVFNICDSKEAAMQKIAAK